MNEPKVSVVIPVYNGSNYLENAIKSVLEQTYQNIEIIVVDDGSDDDGKTYEVAKKFGNKIIYIRKNQGGTASALNVGIETMSGDYFAWLSHDDLFKPYKIANQIEAIKKSGQSEAVAFDNYEFLNMETGNISQTRISELYSMMDITNSLFPFFWFELHFSSLMIHRNILESVGLFKEDLRTSQDNEMLFRLLRGRRLVYSDEVGSTVRLHRQSGTTLNKSCVNQENRDLYLEFARRLSEKEIIRCFGNPGVFYAKIGGIIKSMGGGKELCSLESIWRDWINQDYSRVLNKQDGLNVFLNKKVFIYGAGQYGMRLKYELNSRRIYPEAFIDTAPNKQNNMIDGISCISPEKFKVETEKKDEILLIDSLKTYADAEEIIKNLGVTVQMRKDKVDSLLLHSVPLCIPENEKYTEG